MLTGIEYLNSVVRDKDQSYKGPSTLYKYRPFDKYTFDMLNNDYVFLCAAGKLDDPTECMTTVDLNRLMDLQTNNLKRECVEQIIEIIRPYSSEENFEMARNMIHSIMNGDGTVRPNFMLDVSMELKEMYPNIDIAPFVNWIVGIPDKLDDPLIKPQMELMIKLAMLAREKLGICSLAESSDIEYMWKNYADNESGYCIEYDISDYEFNKSVFPVIYDDDRQTNIIIQIVANFIGQMIFGFSHGEINTDVSQFIRLFLTKNTKWAYQHEWRLLGDADTKAKAPKIKRIILGKQVSEENRNMMMDYAHKNGIEVVD